MRRRSIMNGRIGAKIGASILGGFIVGSSGLAAFGALPGAAQGVASTILAKVGISVPGPNASAATSSSGSHTGDPAGARPAATGVRISGLATTTNATGVTKGALISTAASRGMSRAGVRGSASTVQAGS
jgi:hypothetical protein